MLLGSQPFGGQQIECGLTAGIGNKAGFGQYLEGKEDVVVPVAGIVEPDKVVVDQRAVMLAQKELPVEKDLGSAFCGFL